MAHRLYRRLIAAAAVLAFLPALALAAESDGPALYAEHCAVCHMADGGGVPFMQPALKGAKILGGDGKAVIGRILLGSDSPLPSSGDYANLMPRFESLPDGDIVALANFVRQKFGQQTESLGAADVVAVRDTINGARERDTAVLKARVSQGATLFARNCEMCHFSTAAMENPLPSLPPDVVTGDKARLITRILVGSESTMDVVGFESQGMPAFDRKLDDGAIAALATFLRQRFRAGDVDVAPALVADIRKKQAQP